MLNVHLRINDAASRRPTPVRLRVSDAAGNGYAPLGRLPVFAVGKGEDVGGHLRLNRENWYHIDGGCEIPLPAGVPLRIQATKGPEWTPLDERTVLGAGQISLRFDVARWHADNTVSVDTRAHFVSPHGALLEAAAEGVDVVNVLALVHSFVGQDGNGYPSLSNITAFSGQEPALSRDGYDVFVNTLNVHQALGRLGLLNSHRVVHPLVFGEPDGPDDWSLGDWCRQCHRKGGLVVWADAFRSDRGLLGGEALAQLLLGEVDAIEFDAHPRPQPLLPWVYKLWDAGVKVPIVGGSGKDSNRIPMGAMRTLVLAGNPSPLGERGRGEGDSGLVTEGMQKRLASSESPSPLTPLPQGRGGPAWIQAVRNNRMFITNGPMLRFGIADGKFHASAESIVPFEKLEVVANGQVIASLPSHRNGQEFCSGFGQPLPIEDGWLAARVVGAKGSVLYPDQPAFAHTSAVFVGQPLRPPAALTALRQCLHAAREWVETQGRFPADKHKAKLLDALTAAEAKLDP